VGLDLAKSVLQNHAIDAGGKVVVRRQLRRGKVLKFFSVLSPCLVGMEACASAHHWARELVARGHEVRLMPPAYVKPYVKRGKTDAADAEAIAGAPIASWCSIRGGSSRPERRMRSSEQAGGIAIFLRPRWHLDKIRDDIRAITSLFRRRQDKP
jgi:transposase